MSKNIFLNLQVEFTKKKKSLFSYSIFYNINFNFNSNNLSHLDLINNIIYSKSKSDSINKDEEITNFECDEEINELNFIKIKNDNEYIFQTKKNMIHKNNYIYIYYLIYLLFLSFFYKLMTILYK